MKRLIFSALVLSAVTANAQVKNGMVGINTDEPRATMHIEPGVSESKGLIIPRITAAQMKTMTNLAHFGADHHAIITYLKEQMPAADRTGKLVDVAAPGYYYYDNTTGVQKWKTFGGGAEQDLRAVESSVYPGMYNHLTKDAGIGGNGTSLGEGSGHIAIGSKTFYGFTNPADLSGSNNIAMGKDIYYNNGGTMHGYGNTGIGSTLFQMDNGGDMQGGYNFALGNGIYSLSKANAQFGGLYNFGIGLNLFKLTNGNLTGSSNIGIGQTIFDLTNGDLTGGKNIGMGNTLYKLPSGNMAGERNIGIGYDSYYVKNGDITNTSRNNIALGNYIYRLNKFLTSTFSGQDNIGIGHTLYNLHIGNLAGHRNIGMGNNVFDISSGDFSGNDNIGIGSYAMQVSGGIIGNYNIALGFQTMYTNGKIAGTDNIAIGYKVLQPSGGGNDIGSYNIGIGNWALYADMAKGNANIQIGNRDIGTPVTGQLNQVVAIGNEITNLTTSNTDSNTILLGNQSSNPNSPKVGVGTYKPQAKLDVAGAVRVADDSSACTMTNRGTIRFSTNHFYGCDGTTWKQLDN